jgi:hypothetical protein
MGIGGLMRISASGKAWISEAEFGEFVNAIVRYSTAAELPAIEWYCAAALCRDELCRLPIANYKEIADFVTQHEQEIMGCIRGASA